MSFKATDETITITLPEIPYLSTYPFTVNLPTTTVKTILRLVVIIATYLLFRPHLQRVFRTALGKDDPAAPQSVEGVKNKMRELEEDRGQPIGGGRKVAIATGSGAGAGAGAIGGKGAAPTPRRKA